MIPAQSIVEAKLRIAQLVKDQVVKGAQTTSLNDSDVAACGQFFGPEAETKRQRGIHGTAAALQILEDDSPDLAFRLALYLARRATLDKQLAPDDHSVAAQLDDEQSNTIKVCEALSAILSVDHSKNTELTDFISAKRKALEEASQSKASWPYFFGASDQKEQLLPTIFVLPVLEKLNAKPEEQKVRKYLLQQIFDSNKRDHSNESDDFTRIFCIYTLVFTGDKELDEADKNKLSHLVRTLWIRYAFLFTNDIEQNVEYWRDLHKSYYIRIPWQLYLLALIARLSPVSFASRRAQLAVTRIVEKARDGTFTYSHSNVLPSTRTNYVLYRTLSEIERYYKRGLLFFLLYGMDRTFDFITNKWLRYPLCVLLAILFIIKFGVPWLQSSDAGNQFGGEIVSSVVSAVFAFLLTYRRRT